MRWSDAHARGRLAGFVALAFAGAVSIALQARLATRVALARETGDVSLLPAPERAPLVALGFDSAFGDLVWARLLVDYGTHLQERRRFPGVRVAIDTLLTLDPASSRVFRFVDTLVLFQAKKGTADDARYVRGVLETGLDARPGDPTRWVSYAQYLAHLGPSFLTDDAEIREWELRAGEAYTRALELGAAVDDTRAAVTIFDRAGAGAAQRAYLERAYALATDDEKPILEARLRKLDAASATERIRQHDESQERARLAELPALDMATYRLLRRAEHPCSLPAEWSRTGCLE
jgi:hypothetical protein